jgi:valyl-tRNA synthetase
MGHMLNQTQMDMLVRWHRMRGFITLWLPGTDHAGIATQMMVERQLKKEGKNRRDMGREKFVERVWEWKREYGGAILDQMKRLGASVDWGREYFTMDENLSRAVREVFVRLYEEGLIYRGKYIVNWCPGCETAISDLEVKHEDVAGKLWEIRYPVIRDEAGGRTNASAATQEFITVATTRPETMLGDTAVAINAADERYTHLHGKKVLLPLMKREIPIILDEIAKPEFGTGAVKITPAHDPNDFEAGKRHNLPQIDVMDLHARMNENAGPYKGTRPLCGARGGAGGSEGTGLPGCRKGLHRPAGQVRPLRHGCRAASVGTVVCEDCAAGQEGDCCGGVGRDHDHSRELQADLFELDVQHPRLDDLTAAVVGAPHSGLALWIKIARR